MRALLLIVAATNIFKTNGHKILRRELEAPASRRRLPLTMILPWIEVRPYEPVIGRQLPAPERLAITASLLLRVVELLLPLLRLLAAVVGAILLLLVIRLLPLPPPPLLLLRVVRSRPKPSPNDGPDAEFPTTKMRRLKIIIIIIITLRLLLPLVLE